MGIISGLFRRIREWISAVLTGIKPGDLKAEYLLPKIIDKLLQEKKAAVKVLETQDKWFGVTYQEDKQSVMDAIHGLVEQGIYQKKLFE